MTDEHWVALAATADNQVLAWHSELNILESACQGTSRAICKVYGISGVERAELEKGNTNFLIKFSGPRNTSLVGHNKQPDLENFAKLLQVKVNFMWELHQRIMHGYKRYVNCVPWQDIAYRYKKQDAERFLEDHELQLGLSNEEYPFVRDYANSVGISMLSSARLIKTKADNEKYLIRKLEEIRTRHQHKIRNAETWEDLKAIREEMDKDSFISMLM